MEKMLRLLIICLVLSSCSGKSFTIFRKDNYPVMSKVIEVCNNKDGLLTCEQYIVCGSKINE
jgi:hypothetical protein